MKLHKFLLALLAAIIAVVNVPGALAVKDKNAKLFVAIFELNIDQLLDNAILNTQDAISILAGKIPWKLPDALDNVNFEKTCALGQVVSLKPDFSQADWPQFKLNDLKDIDTAKLSKAITDLIPNLVGKTPEQIADEVRKVIKVFMDEVKAWYKRTFKDIVVRFKIFYASTPENMKLKECQPGHIWDLVSKTYHSSMKLTFNKEIKKMEVAASCIDDNNTPVCGGAQATSCIACSYNSTIRNSVAATVALVSAVVALFLV